LKRLVDGVAQGYPDQEARREIRQRLRQRNPHHVALDPSIEFVADDVARIAIVRRRPVQVGIFDKQPADICPEQTDQWTVRIGPLIGAVMVQAMGGHPPGGRILETANRDDRN
jgi:hypothetical protein